MSTPIYKKWWFWVVSIIAISIIYDVTFRFVDPEGYSSNQEERRIMDSTRNAKERIAKAQKEVEQRKNKLMSMGWVIAKDLVEEKLKSPKSADFPLQPKRSVANIDNNIVTIASHVDSQNSFGAEVRTTFIIELQFLGGELGDIRNWKELSFNTQ